MSDAANPPPQSRTQRSQDVWLKRVFATERGTLTTFSVFVAFVASLIMLIWLADRYRNELGLFVIAPAFVILGSVAFLTGVTVVVSVFSRLGIADRKAALALPDGSVRALLALVLLVIFVIFSNIIFGSFTDARDVRRRFDGLTAAQVDRLPGAVTSQVAEQIGRGAEPTYRGEYLAPRNEDASQLGQQIVTGLLTLVATISAFYFGTGSVKAAADAINRTTGQSSLRVLRPSQPVVLKRNDDGSLAPLEITLGGSVLDDAGVKATLRGDDTGRVESRGGSDTYVYTPGDPAGPVTVTFTSQEDSGVTAELVISVPAASAPVTTATTTTQKAAPATKKSAVRRSTARPAG